MRSGLHRGGLMDGPAGRRVDGAALSELLRSALLAEGAALVGFADLRELPAAVRCGLPRGISLAASFPAAMVAEVVEGPTAAYVEACLRLDEQLTGLGERAVRLLRAHGHAGQRQATTNAVGAEYPPGHATALPHKTVATLAGLGWIGRSALLVTRSYGPDVRLTSILTDAPLTTGRPVVESECGSCCDCVDACPAGAIQGAEWTPGLPRDSLVAPALCSEIAARRLTARTGGTYIGRTFCGMCMAACPRGRQGDAGRTV